MSDLPDVAGMTEEDSKLVTLARAARLRAYGPTGEARAEGAALRDSDGRTYASASVGHTDPSLATSALRGAYVAAVSSGARSFEAAALVGDDVVLDSQDRSLLRELAPGIPVWLTGADGSLLAAERV